MTHPHKTGRIKRFDPHKGFGFIIADGSSQELFFHITDVIGGKVPSAHMLVSFRPGHSDKGPRAFDVTVLTEDGKCPLCGAEKVAR